MYQVSASVARRIPWHQTIEVGYVGTFGRNLTAKSNINAIQPGGLNAALPGPARSARRWTDGAVNALRPFPAYGNLFYLQNIGVSDYHALQATLSRQTGAFTYLAAYTLSKNEGTDRRRTSAASTRSIPTALPRHARHRPHALRRPSPGPGTWATRPRRAASRRRCSTAGTSRASRPTPAASRSALGFTRRHRRRPGGPRLVGHAGLRQLRRRPAATTTPATSRPSSPATRRLSGGSSVGDKILDVNCIGIPAFGQTGPIFTPYNLRSPARNFHDLTRLQGLQAGRRPRACSSASGRSTCSTRPTRCSGVNGTSDFDLTLDTECNVRVNGVSNGAGGTADNVCDPTRRLPPHRQHDRATSARSSPSAATA